MFIKQSTLKANSSWHQQHRPPGLNGYLVPHWCLDFRHETPSVTKGFPKHRNPDPTSFGQKNEELQIDYQIFFWKHDLTHQTHWPPHTTIYTYRKKCLKIVVNSTLYEKPTNCNSWGHHNWPRVSCTYVARDSNTLTSPPGLWLINQGTPGHVSPPEIAGLIKGLLTIGFP